ncbi:benzoate 4-monooxygenase cytochrome P450 [Periconia macrospinosa]|uniref:Benzoate 4-monooxygenase cytochrome P450 n=1 Tax=Periconia macrospinosa TaxID=97972 RepID=A0A2V1DZ36_9PLEO|nr:benzoate 4-monooxygenase cytochrome P450 [Periconia macrospinosa]
MFQESNTGPAILTVAACILYNVCFHPLAKFPGPWYATISNFWYSMRFLGGRQPKHILSMHRKYGPVVRIAPNELSFNTAQAWKDIYNYSSGNPPFVKSKFYEGGTFADQCGSIVSERDPEEHGRMRKLLSHAFSQRSLVEQEPLILGVINKFIRQLSIYAERREVIELNKWFNMVTFDIIGELAFGESFGGVETGNLHPWIARIKGAMKQGALADTFKRFPTVGSIAMILWSSTIERLTLDCKLNEEYALDLVRKRISRKSERKDFLTRILEERDESISDVQIAAHSADFVTAGSETTATALACINYYLSKDKTIRKKLQEEIRGAFSSYEEINSASTAPLRYLNAVCLEGMRIYPPLPFALPRLVPKDGSIVDGHFIPPGVTVSTNPVATCLDPSNFRDPFTFKPERWLEHNGYDNLDASQPFSIGPRGCLGRSLGWMEMRIIMAKLHFVFDLELTDPDLDWQGSSRMHTLWQNPQLQMRVQLAKRS